MTENGPIAKEKLGDETDHVLAEGDVVSWNPVYTHCREGYAVAIRRTDGTLVLIDTFWSDKSGYQLRDEAWSFVFNINDFDELDRYAQNSRSIWMKYHPADRTTISSQHGLRRRYFVRKGAVKDLSTEIANAKNELIEAEQALRTAQNRVDYCRQELFDKQALDCPVSGDSQRRIDDCQT